MKNLGIFLIFFSIISCEQSTDSEINGKEKTVVIQTEYETYQLSLNPNVEIHFTLTDNTDSTLYIFYWCRTVFDIEKYEDSLWNNYINTICPAIGRISTMEVGNRVWESEGLIYDTGRFRIKFPISRDSSDYYVNQNIRYIYSNEFEVK